MRTKFISAIAILAIAVGLYGLSNELLDVPEVAPEPVVQEETVKIWFAKRDIKRAETVKRSDLELKTVLESAANRFGITGDVELEFARGAVFDHAIAAGQTVMPEDIVAPQELQFIDLVIKKDSIPFAIKVDNEDVVGGLINYGTYVDILAIADADAGLASNADEVQGSKSLFVSPVLMAIRVLQVQYPEVKTETDSLSEPFAAQEGETLPAEINLVLELTRKQLAKLTIAQRIAELQIHKSIGNYQASDLSSNAGDVLPYYRAIKEFRSDKITIN